MNKYIYLFLLVPHFFNAQMRRSGSFVLHQGLYQYPNLTREIFSHEPFARDRYNNLGYLAESFNSVLINYLQTEAYDNQIRLSRKDNPKRVCTRKRN